MNSETFRILDLRSKVGYRSSAVKAEYPEFITMFHATKLSALPAIFADGCLRVGFLPVAFHPNSDGALVTRYEHECVWLTRRRLGDALWDADLKPAEPDTSVRPRDVVIKIRLPYSALLDGKLVRWDDYCRYQSERDKRMLEVYQHLSDTDVFIHRGRISVEQFVEIRGIDDAPITPDDFADMPVLPAVSPDIRGETEFVDHAGKTVSRDDLDVLVSTDTEPPNTFLGASEAFTDRLFQGMLDAKRAGEKWKS